jgi:hypothetical protein
MPLLSSSISHRYTPPTCTLEVTTQTSALSRWTRRPSFQVLQFQLSFESLSGSRPQPVHIYGDPRQLESLVTRVEDYVQQLLCQASSHLLTGLSLTDAVSVVESSDSFELSTAEDSLKQEPVALAVASDVDPPQDIYLRPRNLLFHDLVLGSLATESSGPVISLSVSQLFDLASALEDYTAELEALPELQNQPLSWVSATPIWARSAALVVAAVGITTAVFQLINNSVPAPTTISQKPSVEATGPSTALIKPPPPPSGATAIPAPPKNLPTPVVPVTPGLKAPSSPTDIETGQSAPLPRPVPQIPVTQIPIPASRPSAPEVNIQPSQPEQQALPTIAARQAAPAADGSQPKIAESAQPDQEGTAANTSAAAPTQTAFDTIPQVAEVREYFAQRWQPPAELSQTLEYTLVINPNGSIQRVIPLSKASEVYLDRTPIPLANEPFVSPVQGKSNPKIRLVLGKDGKVQSFLQSP